MHDSPFERVRLKNKSSHRAWARLVCEAGVAHRFNMHARNVERAVEQGRWGYRRVVKAFGTEILQSDGATSF